MLKIHPLVQQIEELFLPELQRLASQLSEQFPALTFNVWHSPMGTLTEYQGYDVGLECVFPRSAEDATGNVALSIDLCHLNSTPRLMASVGWGHPSGQLEGEFKDWAAISDWPEATPETIEELRAAFPRLVQEFIAATHRAVPSPSAWLS